MTDRIPVLERLIRQHKDTKPKWVKQWEAELAQLKAARDRASGKRMGRAWAECQTPAHQQALAQTRRDRQRRPGS